MEQNTFSLGNRRSRGRHRGVIDRMGQRYGKLVVIGLAAPRFVNGKPRVHWLCQCDCGNKTEVWSWSLGRGATRSCGCLVTDLKLAPGGYARNRVLKEYKRNARTRGLCWELADEDFDRLTSQPCFYCGLQPSMVKVAKRSEFTYTGIDRKDNSLGYIPGNVLPACQPCNFAKGRMSYGEFMAWIARLTEYHWFHPELTPSRLLRGVRQAEEMVREDPVA